MSLFLLLEMKMIICHGSGHKANDVEQECYMIELNDFEIYTLAPSLGVFHGAVQPGIIKDAQPGIIRCAQLSLIQES